MVEDGIVTVWLNYVDQVLIFAVYALSLNLLLGYAGQVSVAHAAFGAVGGYTVVHYTTTHGMGYLPALAIGVLLAAVLGTILALVSMRLSVEFLVLLTLALGQVLVGLIATYPWLGATFGITTGVPPASVFGRELTTAEAWVIPLLVVVAITFAICWRIGESPYGRVLRALREDEAATQSLGKNVFRAKVIVFAVSTALAGLAGGLYSGYFRLAKPQAFEFGISIAIFTMVVIGGQGNLWGSLVGAAMVIFAEPFLERVVDLSPETAGVVRLILYGVLLLVVIALRPQGLIPEGLRLRRSPAPPATARVVGDRDQGTDRERPSPGHPVLEVAGLSKRFGGIVAAEDLALVLSPGEITALIGPNGAGKTTVFNLLTGFIRPDDGRARLNGTDVVGLTPDAVARSGMVRSFQDVRLFQRLSCLDNVALAVPDQAGERFDRLWWNPASVRDDVSSARARAMHWLEFVGLEDRALTPAAGLGYGEAKLVALARVMATEAPVLLLDEPASGIDTEWVERMKELIARVRDEGRTVCLVEHNLHVVEALADRGYFMELGRITAEGSLDELMSDPRLAAAYFGGGYE